MKNRKMNLDRPPLDSKEIQAGMNFGQLMISYQVMSKPFYKTKWFFGTAGMASIGLIVGGTFAFQSNEAATGIQVNPVITDSPPVVMNTESPEKELLAVNFNEEVVFEEKKETDLKVIKKTKDDKKSTLLNPNEFSDKSESESLPEVESKVVDDQSEQQKSTFGPIDMTPRINGKMNGDITREDLLDNKGLTTNADVSIIHFELHLIDGLGGKVFEEESNQLNKEMKDALKNVHQGETIYFENIKGKTPEGHIVRLNPLRYVLLN